MHEYSSILGPVDSAFYYVDQPETPMNIGALAIFDGYIDFDQFSHLIDARIHQSPRYRQRLVQAALNLGQPTWVNDPDFHIGNHVMRASVDAPGTEEQLRELVGHLLSSRLDRDKPLWEVYLIDGLEGKTASFFKVHHCMVDGMSAIELFTLLMDLSPEYSPPGRKPFFDPPELPKPHELLVDSIIRDVPHKFSVLRKLGEGLLQFGGVMTDPDKRLKALIGVAHLINSNLQPIKRLAINGRNTGRQSLYWAEFSLAEVRAIRSGSRASVNDVMLTVLASAIESYCKKRGTNDQNYVRVLMPVNMRMDNEKGQYGNRISVLPVDCPFNIVDPLERLNTIANYSRVMKESSLSNTMDTVLTLPSLMPAPTQSLIWGLAPTAFSLIAHTWCTNVAGAQIPVYLLGHQMEHCYGYFPLNPTFGMACVVMSYNQRITMTLVVDNGIIDDPEELLQNLKSAYNVLRRAAKVPEMQPVNVERVDSGSSEPASSPPAVQATVNGTSPSADAVPVAVAISALGSGGEAAQTQTQTEAPAPTSAPSTPTPEVRTAYRLFSDEWAKALAVEVNNSRAYRRVSQNWTYGSLAFVMKASPRNGFSAPAAVLLDLHRGECRGARALSQNEAMQLATFVIEGDYPSWMEVLGGKSSPLVMLTRGQLKLKKGSLTRLLPNTQSAQELVRCAQRVPYL
ncbi:MAG: wax ester/triacylglycerol synthase family O-acyltransferase [Chloroflexi bacterium]|nr:wax ester/triacylglycerol synthase family O-acyltransferase [Chloroflexota bacterium]